MMSRKNPIKTNFLGQISQFNPNRYLSKLLSWIKVVAERFLNIILRIPKATFVAIDFETANNDRDSACAIGIVRVENNKITAKEMRLINPQTYFLEGFTRDVHGISQEDVEDEPLFDQVWQELAPFFNDTDFIAAHNASFDKSVLYRCCESYGITPPRQRFVCTVKVARDCWKLKPTKLNNVCDHLKIELNHHEALSDALACAQIVIRALNDGYDIRSS